MGVLDSSILFLPFGNDLLVVALTARHPSRFWLYALAATAGSLIGCTITDFLSRKLGEAELNKMVKPDKLQKVQKRLKDRAFWGLGLAAVIPPPFPFTVFLIVASTIQIPRSRILVPIGVGRIIRFTSLAILARHYGTALLRLSKRPEVEYFVIGLAVVSIVGSAFSLVKWLRSTRRRRGEFKEPQAA
jgi:membrane protein YqaA with SNARE-associated domain